MVYPPAIVPTRIMIVDDHPIFLNGLRAILQDQPAIQIIAEAADGASALTHAAFLTPDIIILDISLPDLNGIDVARQILKLGQCRKILFLTACCDSSVIVKAFEAGAGGYLLKSSAISELGRAISALAEGGMYLDPKIGAETIQQFVLNRNILDFRSPHLSGRELQVMRLMAIGHTNKSIAQKLCIAIKTVETHKSRAMVKLGFSNRVETMRFAMAQGWLKDQPMRASLPG